MSGRSSQRAPIGRRPAADPAAQAWIQQQTGAPGRAQEYTARLTIDVTPGLRGRIKVIAFERGVTVAEMLRELLEREFARTRVAP
ncbi:ribbon-helix-helix protein [Caenimonas soli]|uniref:ribbon-helix-helix protein n=1 Tax=Caenimonas soli TaxID=2735555 RepID=UPI001557C452|nr:chromosome partitioning protein ParB [Caenimonas soli]NPC57792.1 chromosome partitioning protein ParB [Caenimonas soli]